MTLTLDGDAVIREASLANAVSSEGVQSWLGRPWIDTVCQTGVDKVRRLIDDARSSGVSGFRQINQRFPSGLELPIEYTTVRLGGNAGLIAIGKNLHASSELQSRLLAAQQAMERDYWKLREVETRYRLLFDASNEAVLVLKAGDLSVAEANPAAIRALGLTRGWDFLAELAAGEREGFRSMLSRVRESGRAPGSLFHLGANRRPWILRAALMNDEAAPVYMIQLVPVGGPVGVPDRADSASLTPLLQRIADGLVILGRDGIVMRANQAFLDMVQVGAEGAAIGQRLDRWLRRPGADLAALMANLRRNGSVRLFPTTITGELGGNVEVEISAAGDTVDQAGFVGVVIRDVGRRLSSLAVEQAGATLPALQDLSGGTSLREMVQAAVEAVERHYVEQALRRTEGNRTAAAELLGLSRQSLYAKLNRYGADGGLETGSAREA